MLKMQTIEKYNKLGDSKGWSSKQYNMETKLIWIVYVFDDVNFKNASIIGLAPNGAAIDHINLTSHGTE